MEVSSIKYMAPKAAIQDPEESKQLQVPSGPKKSEIVAETLVNDQMTPIQTKNKEQTYSNMLPSIVSEQEA